MIIWINDMFPSFVGQIDLAPATVPRCPPPSSSHNGLTIASIASLYSCLALSVKFFVSQTTDAPRARCPARSAPSRVPADGRRSGRSLARCAADECRHLQLESERTAGHQAVAPATDVRPWPPDRPGVRTRPSPRSCQSWLWVEPPGSGPKNAHTAHGEQTASERSRAAWWKCQPATLLSRPG